MTKKVEHLKRRVIWGYVSILVTAIIAVIYISNLVTRIAEEEKGDNPRGEKTSVITKALLLLYEGESLTQFIDDENEDFALFNLVIDSVAEQLRLLESYAPDSSMQEKINGIGLLLSDKRENTRLMMETRREMNMLYSKYISGNMETGKKPAKETEIKKEEDIQQSTMLVQRQRKGFLKRLAEAFVPVKSDTALVTNSTTRLRTDSLVNEYNPADTIAHVLNKIRAGIDREYSLLNTQLNQRINDLKYSNAIITGRIGRILSEIESEESTLALAREAAKSEIVRQTSIRLAVIALVFLLIILAFLYLTLRDVSRSRYYRTQLENAKQFAEDLLQSREKFMLMISHDLRAPLSSILGYIELLKQNRHANQYLENITVLSRHILSLVNDLLDFHRLESGKMTIRPVTFNIAVLFEEIYAGFKPLTDSGKLDFNLDITAIRQSPIYVGDPIRIRQAVSNLLSNAIKFTPAGSVYLTVSAQPANDTEANLIIISVKDEGPGIKESEQKIIFKEFTRLAGSEKTEGFGLGLSIACKIVSLMDGNISLDSVAGKGSVFTIAIPLPQAGNVDGNDPADAPPTLLRHGLNCLAIDDDLLQLKLTEELLRRNHINITAISNPRDALDQLSSATSFDLILTDIQMPLLDGYELLKRVRNTKAHAPATKNIPVIALTAGISEEKEHYAEAGFDGFLNKPLTIEEFTTLVNKLLPPQTQTPPDEPNVAALTAFAGNDATAAAAILQSFSEETQKSLSLLQKALAEANRQQAAAISHKLIPLFTLLEAKTIVALLRTLETNENATNDPQWKQTLAAAIARIQALTDQINVQQTPQP
ncbi:MAG: response regulator [Tannerellaceae bacterium]|jgi:signal transduction histidine kinase/CheY-like chemotaxis protein|nr:response regulator [Tannerellaceae bacterium]